VFFLVIALGGEVRDGDGGVCFAGEQCDDEECDEEECGDGGRKSRLVISALSQLSFIPTSCAHLTFPGLDNLTTTAQIGQILGVL